jgi:hypothetical protein
MCCSFDFIFNSELSSHFFKQHSAVLDISNLFMDLGLAKSVAIYC